MERTHARQTQETWPRTVLDEGLSIHLFTVDTENQAGQCCPRPCLQPLKCSSSSRVFRAEEADGFEKDRQLKSKGFDVHTIIFGGVLTSPSEKMATCVQDFFLSGFSAFDSSKAGAKLLQWFLPHCSLKVKCFHTNYIHLIGRLLLNVLYVHPFNIPSS